MDNTTKNRITTQRKSGVGDDPQFAFDLRDDLADDGAPVGSSGGVVVILLNPGERTGIAFSPDAARKVGMALIECAKMAEIEAEEESKWGIPSGTPSSNPVS